MNFKTCETCARIAEGRALPPGIFFHCTIDGCHVSLTGHGSAIHCHEIDPDGNVIGCGRSFGGQVAYDAHKGPNGLCRDPDTLTRENGEPRFKAVRRKSCTVWVQSRLGGPYQPPGSEDPPCIRSTPRREDVA